MEPEYVKMLEEFCLIESPTDYKEGVDAASNYIIKKAEALRAWAESNAFIRALGYIDSEGNVDLDGIVSRVKEFAREKGKIEINIPFMPAWKFTEQDIDEIHKTIIGE